MSGEEVRQFFLDLVDVKHAARNTLTIYLLEITCLCEKTLRKDLPALEVVRLRVRVNRPFVGLLHLLLAVPGFRCVIRCDGEKSTSTLSKKPPIGQWTFGSHEWPRVVPFLALAHPLAGGKPMERLEKGVRITQLIGVSPSFLAEARKIPLMAQCGSCVLISGEPGTGKETCARTIHDLSSRTDKPFVPVNCGALLAAGSETELFGRGGKGSAVNPESRGGSIQDAAGGTLFLDEIDHLSLPVQVKLLRYIREGALPQGESRWKTHPIVRVIAAVDGDPLRAVLDGELRSDLFSQLNVLPLRMVPLRERREDIVLLAHHFLQRFCRAMMRQPLRLSDGGARKMLLHDWPGNIRELEHLIERAVALSDEPEITENGIVFESGELWVGTESFREAKARFVEQFEKRYIEKLLLIHRGNISRAARTAQKDRRAFWELIRKHGIAAEQYKDMRSSPLNAVI